MSFVMREKRGEGLRLIGLRRYSLIVLVVIFFVAFYLRAFPLTYSHLWDESVYLQDAKVISEGRTNYSELIYRPPLLSVFFAAGFLLWDNVYVANVVEGFLTFLLVLFGYLFVRSVWNEASAIAVAVLFALSPYIVDRSHELMTDAPAISLMMGSLFFFSKRNKTSLFFSGALFAMSILTRFTSMFLAVYFALFILVFRKSVKECLFFFMGAVLCILPYLAWAKINYGDSLFPIVYARWVIMMSPYVPPSTFFYGLGEIFPWVVLIGLLLWVVMFTAAASKHVFRGGKLRERLAGLDDSFKHEFVLSLWGTLFFLYMLTITHKETRYLLPLAIPALILSVAGFFHLYRMLRGRSIYGGAAVVVLFISLSAYDFYPLWERLDAPLVDDAISDTVAVAQYIKDNSREKDTIYAITNFPVLAFYSSRKTVSLLDVGTDLKAGQELMKDEGFYVYFNEDAEKDVLFRKDFLDKTASFREINQFGDLLLYRYSPPL
jgi:hypothetical protein